MESIMIIDLKHNRIIEATMTEAFAKSFDECLVPKLLEKYGNEISFVQMYEDHIADGFTAGGEFYYPLTLIKGGQALTQWIKWKLTKGEFDPKSPYAFNGKALNFSLADEVPEEFSDKLSGRARFAESGLIKIKIEMPTRDITFLSGRYSQTFVDEMARQLTPAIEEAMSVKGIADSPLELCLVFSPESYMEHTSENVTYRRLLLADKSGAPKDFWIKWTRLDGATAYTIASAVNSANILFEIGEDVSQKIREKEYRFLLQTKGKDKYHNSMGRKNITDWREIVKRVIKRGELVKIETETVICKETEALTRELASVVAQSGAVSYPETEVVASKQSDRELLESLKFAKKKLDEDAARALEEETDIEEIEDEFESDGFCSEEDSDFKELHDFYRERSNEYPEQSVYDADEDKEQLAKEAREALSALKATEVIFDDEIEDEEEFEDEYQEEEEASDGVDVSFSNDPCTEEYCEEEYSELEDEDELEEEAQNEVLSELSELEGEVTEEKAYSVPAFDAKDVEAKIRAEIEAKVRLEYEMDARRRAESEAERLRLENERLQSEKRKEEEARAAKERERLEETEKLKAQIEAKLRAEARERERLAEAARAAVEEQRRLEEERAKIERMRLEEERRAEAERQARELEAKRAAEVDRITRETEARIRAEYEAKRLEAQKLEEQRQREQQKAAEQAPAESSSELKEQPIEPSPNYTYTSKIVKLLFRRSVDPNITARIHEIVKATLDYYGKSKVYLKIKATVPDSQTVVLEFLKIPMEEMELLGNIIKVLGNSGLGIAKAIVE